MSQQAWPAGTPGSAPLDIPESITIRKDSLHPPGVAWDPTRNAFLVSSMRHGTVSVVRPDGGIEELIRDPDVIASVGLRVDAVRGRVVLAYADAGFADRSGPDTKFRVSGVAVYDLATGGRLHLVELGASTFGGQLLHDVELDRFGNIYATDTPDDAVYRIDVDGNPSVVRRGPKLETFNVGFMGLVLHPDGFLLTVRHDDGKLYRIPVQDPDTLDEVELDQPLVGADGMALQADGSLVAVTNTLIGPGKNGVSVLRSDDGWRTARTERRVEPWPDPAPTAVAVTPYGAYVVSGRPDRLVEAVGAVNEFSLRRL